jgi:hypothetical protein
MVRNGNYQKLTQFGREDIKMKLRDLFDISMADFYEIHNGDLTYKVKKDEINIFIQDYRATIDADVPMLKQSAEQDFIFGIGFEVYIN